MAIILHRVLPQRPNFHPQDIRIRIGLAVLVGVAVVAATAVTTYYLDIASRVDKRLAAGPFSDSVAIYSAPHRLSVGDPIGMEKLQAELTRAGYSTRAINSRSLELTPVQENGERDAPIVVEFDSGRISRIVSTDAHRELQEIDLAPQLMADLSDRRERRRLVRFAQLPPVLVNAVTSAEDKRFFHHSGFDLLRAIKAAYVDVKAGRKKQGASTLTMQLARGLWLEPDKRWKRKLKEVLITVHLERRLTKQQIFEGYANQVYLGQRDTFSIQGFAEAARAYFGKNLSQLTVSDAALLAGMVQRPSYYNPYRYPDRARNRRDVVLRLMRQNEAITEDQYRAALASGLNLSPKHANPDESSYFFDLVRDELRNRAGGEGAPRRIYTSLDPFLQNAAGTAVRNGMQQVDRLVRRGRPQAALVALDPRTGEIKALVGGRDYGASQLNHATAMRQPGSVFKPFVYAAALNTALNGAQDVLTPATILNDEPRAFDFDGRVYEPHNYHHGFLGPVTMRTALIHSLNVATVELAMRAGLANVADVARRMGLDNGIKATPALALGAYEATPLQIAGAYTAFANQGMRVAPSMVSEVRGADGKVLYRHTLAWARALDPRVAFLMVSMMEDVLQRGTGASVRSLGFRQPAAGKTGTSRDGWFAGFTSELLCVVWVGFDDNRDLGLEGARSALPIWTEFMKQAAQYRPYRDAAPFGAPAGVASVALRANGSFASSSPESREEFFIDGTAPTRIGPARGEDAPSAAPEGEDSVAPEDWGRGPGAGGQGTQTPASEEEEPISRAQDPPPKGGAILNWGAPDSSPERLAVRRYSARRCGLWFDG